MEESVIPVLADIDVLVESQDIEACQWFGKPERDKSQKTIVRFVNRKNCKKALFKKDLLSVWITANTILRKIQKFLQMRI